MKGLVPKETCQSIIDLFESNEGKIRTSSNRSGGVQGGISNGEELYFRTAFKPTATVCASEASIPIPVFSKMLVA